MGVAAQSVDQLSGGGLQGGDRFYIESRRHGRGIPLHQPLTAGERCALARRAKGWTQEQAAKEAGVSRVTVLRWEQDTGDCRHYARLLNVALHWWEEVVCPCCHARVFVWPPTREPSERQGENSTCASASAS